MCLGPRLRTHRAREGLKGWRLGSRPQQAPRDPCGKRRHWPSSLAIFCPPKGLPLATDTLRTGGPLLGWTPLPSCPSRPQVPSLACAFPPVFLPTHVLPGGSGVAPIPLGVGGSQPVPGRRPSRAEMGSLHPPSLPPSSVNRSPFSCLRTINAVYLPLKHFSWSSMFWNWVETVVVLVNCHHLL